MSTLTLLPKLFLLFLVGLWILTSCLSPAFGFVYPMLFLPTAVRLRSPRPRPRPPDLGFPVMFTLWTHGVQVYLLWWRKRGPSAELDIIIRLYAGGTVGAFDVGGR